MPSRRQAMPLNDKGLVDRRKLMAGTTGALSALLLGGCDRLSEDTTVQSVLASAENLTRRVQRLLGGSHTLAPEYAEADLSKEFKANGTLDPDDDDYQALASKQFVDWRLEVTGLVDRPARYSLDELRAMPSRTQITRHDCVEGWSCIGKWKGAPLSALLLRAVIKPQARFIIFRSADSWDEASLDFDREASPYYESIDLIDAFHPQTILAYDMNEAPLEV